MVPGSEALCYELGSSTGSLTLKLAAHNAHKPTACFIGIDCQEEMVGQARDKQRDAGIETIEFVTDDFITSELEPCDLITAYYAIQFVRPSVRQEVINKIYQGLHWGGGFLLFEKVRASDARFQDMMTCLYTEYKLEQGYTSEEVIGKRTRALFMVVIFLVLLMVNAVFGVVIASAFVNTPGSVFPAWSAIFVLSARPTDRPASQTRCK